MKSYTCGNRPINCIIFDLDGVLVDSAQVTQKAARLALDEIGINSSNIDFSPYFGTGEKNFIIGPCTHFGKLNLADTAITRFYEIFYELCKTEMKVFPSAVLLIEALRQKSFKLAIASSSALPKIKASLKAAKIPKRWFDAIVSGNDVKERKPSPEIYMKTASVLDANPHNCLVVEDALSGIVAAKQAGMRCFAVTTAFSSGELAKSGADFVADDLLQVLDYLI